MLKSYFTIAWRYLIKDRRFTLLNLIGLASGMACALLIYLWVSDELHVDKFHKKEARLYQVKENRKQATGIWTAPTTSAPTAEALAKDMPEVEYATAVDPISYVTLSVNNEKNIRADGQYAGPDFFNIFSYDLIDGNPAQVLTDKRSIALSDVLAIKLFGTTENVIGKTVEFQHNQQYKVSGIFKEPGAHSSEQFDFVLPIALSRDSASANDWDNTGNMTYLTLKPGSDPDKFNAKIADLVRNKTNNKITHRTPFITRYSDNYLYGRYENGVRVGGRIEYVRLFSIIAIFILVIACINFMNLSTAKAAGRAKEVGIRKTMGAGRGTLILQYFGESMLMAFASLLLAILLVNLILPSFNEITGKHLEPGNTDPRLIISAIGITLFTGIVSGSYPALYLSAFKPALVLKGKLKSSVGEILTRKGLVVFQFTLSAILIVAVIVVYRQISFIQTKNLGYDRDHVISFFKEGKLSGEQQQETFLAAVRNLPGIIQASSSGHNLSGHNSGTYGLSWPGRDPKDKTEFEDMPVGYNIQGTLGLQVAEGRFFSGTFGSDSTKVIFNEAAIQYMGLKEPIGKTIKIWDQNMEIIGVVKNFHFQSMHEKVKPLFIRLAPQDTYLFMVKIEAGKEKAAIDGLTRLYQQYNPGFSFNYRFMDERFQTLYAAEQRVSVLSRYFAGLAILISCLGLFGLAAFTAQRRSKEIGIRKVLGATVEGMVVLLSKDFLKLVLLAILIAFPLAWWGTERWLNGFAYHIQVGIGVFIIAAITIILITFLTVSFLSVKAALANPVKSLRND